MLRTASRALRGSSALQQDIAKASWAAQQFLESYSTSSSFLSSKLTYHQQGHLDCDLKGTTRVFASSAQAETVSILFCREIEFAKPVG